MQGSPFPERSLDRLSCIPSRIPPKESTVILSPVLSFLVEKQSFPSLQLRNNQINSCSAPLMLDIGGLFLVGFVLILSGVILRRVFLILEGAIPSPRQNAESKEHPLK